jgi:hypothetical protein
MPVNPAPDPAGQIFLLGSIVIMMLFLVWWAVSSERRKDLTLPLVFLGTALSALLIEPIFDNTLLYWYPDENPYDIYRAYNRTIPWFVPIGYAWFFGGSAYLVYRAFLNGITVKSVWIMYLGVVAVDWLAVSIAEWMELSAFYGAQPFRIFGGSPLWFSFCDAAGGFVLGAALYGLMPRLVGWRKLLLLILPTFTYGATLGSATAPISLALNSGWSTLVVWLAGAATIGLCCIAVGVIAELVSQQSSLKQ